MRNSAAAAILQPTTYRAHEITARLVVRARRADLRRQYPSPLGMSGARAIAEREEPMATITLTVFFEDPFWVGVVEREEEGALEVARHLFGAEPSGPEVHEFILRRLVGLLDHPRAAVAIAPATARPANPKRAARAAARALAQRGTSTQAQEALRLQLEQHKQERKQRRRAMRDAEAARKRQIKVAKAKARHRGH